MSGQSISKKAKKLKLSQQRREVANLQQKLQPSFQQLSLYPEQPCFDNMPMQQPAFDPRKKNDTSPRYFNQPQNQSCNFNQPQPQFHAPAQSQPQLHSQFRALVSGRIDLHFEVSLMRMGLMLLRFLALKAK